MVGKCFVTAKIGTAFTISSSAHPLILLQVPETPPSADLQSLRGSVTQRCSYWWLMFVIKYYTPGRSHTWGSLSLACKRGWSTMHWSRSWGCWARWPRPGLTTLSCSQSWPEPSAETQPDSEWSETQDLIYTHEIQYSSYKDRSLIKSFK